MHFLGPSDKEEDDFRSFIEIYKYENVNLYEYFKFYEDRDLIFHEISNRYQRTIKYGYEYFKNIYSECEDFLLSSSQTFLHLLSKKKDTHIAKRFGNEIASEVKSIGQEIVKLGGIFSEDGKEKIKELDKFLRSSQSRNINPGSTADITGTTLFFAILDGYR